ncbi:peptidoglycan recognition protein family protein [Streptomyces liangshanensis]|uniref:peptidoglycan recognition protein family protein n=1 Tax=Streptomyces liangshanensis TaxID=2717324 RepID=UPI0036DAFA7E
MATPMTPDQWIKALREEGVTDIVEMPGWRTNNRNHKGPFSSVHATMIHHTAGEGSGLPSLVFNGTGDLPGPLCHDYLARSGRLYLVGNGRANHAGTVAANAYDAVLNEREVHPAPDAAEPLDGNAVSYGLECENNGDADRTWPAVQYDIAVRVQAARCRFHGWSANSVWAHKEATRRKPVDPRLPMNQFRDDVAERLAHPASWNPTTEEDNDMPLSPTDIAAVADATVTKLLAGGGALENTDLDRIWSRDVIPAARAPYANSDVATNPTWSPAYSLQTAVEGIRQVLAVVTRIETAVAALGNGVDTAAVVTAVQAAIAQAVIDVDVNITSTPGS